MDKHTMHVLKDVTAHKEAIIQNVRQQIQQEPHLSKPKWTYRAVTILITCSLLLFIVWQASKPMNQLATEVLNEEEKTTFTDLFQTEFEGVAPTYSQLFFTDQLSHRENPTYYAPLQGLDAMQEVAKIMNDAVHLVEPDNLPFKANIQEVYAVTSEMQDGSLQTQYQFSYKEKSYAGVDRQFIHFTVTNVDKNPLAGYDVTQDAQDILGNRVANVGLNFMNPLYHHVITSVKGSTTNLYYNYDLADKRVYYMSTLANELYTYYNGYVYHIGYQLDGDPQEVQEKVTTIARDFILGK